MEVGWVGGGVSVSGGGGLGEGRFGSVGGLLGGADPVTHRRSSLYQSRPNRSLHASRPLSSALFGDMS